MKNTLLFILSISGLIANAQVPLLLKDINPGTLVGANTVLINLNNNLIFSGNQPSTGTELWISDGTTANTSILKDINFGSSNGSQGSYPSLGTFSNGYYYFTANDGINGTELWKTDLTNAGTNLVKDVVPGNVTSYPYLCFVLNNKMYFSTNNPSMLYETDGTAANTILFTPNIYNITSCLKFNSKVYFSASTSTVSGTDALYVTDGTFAGTQLVKDFNTGTAGSDITYMVPLNATQFLVVANDGVVGEELWISDGTPSGTTLLKDLNTGAASSYCSNFGLYNGKVYFKANVAGVGNELFVTDGTANGTQLVKDIRVGVGGSGPDYIIELNGLMHFIANDGSGRELWKSDGTAVGTTMVKDINPGTGFGINYGMYLAGNKLYFGGNDGVKGNELWVSDGTTNGTQMVYDLNTGINDGFYGSSFVANIGNQIFFIGDDGATGWEVYSVIDLTNNLKEENALTLNFSIYPNPASEFINVKLDLINEEKTIIKISNILGETVLFESATSNNFILKTNNLKSGVYFISITNQGKQSTQKIIIE